MSLVAATPVEILTAPVSGPSLVRDYHAGEPALAPFFFGHPYDPDAYRRKAEAVSARVSPTARRLVAPAMRPLNDVAADKLERVLAGDGVLVTTGQQAGLVGGPFYTVHKILTAIRLATTLESILDMPVLPVFWVAADDHDWAEVDHTVLVDAGNELRRIQLAQSPDAIPHSMAQRTLGAEVLETVEAFVAAMPKSEFAGPLIDLVRQVYRPGASMAGAFEELLADLFSSFELVLVNGAHPALKQAARSVFRHEIEHAGKHAALLARRAKALEELGYRTQVPISTDAANVFFHGDEGRERLVREDGSWLLRRTKRRLDDAELQRLLAGSPERFSANVLLRPVVESKLLPTIAYVGGPSEISYFAEIGCLFREHDLEPPIVFPRISVTLVEARVRKVLDKFSLTAPDFQRPFHEVVSRVLRDEMPEDVTAALEALRTALQTGYGQLQNAAVRVDPTLGGWIEGVRNGALGNVDGAAKKIASHFRKRHETEVEQLRKAWVHLYPDGELQERVLSPMPYLARYGTALLADILGAMRVQWAVPNPGWTGVRCDD